MMNPLIVGIPAFRERAWLPRTLEHLARQDDPDFQVWVCVNQPRSYARDPAFAAIHAENTATLAWLSAALTDWPFQLVVLDAVSENKAPDPKSAGVGWARRRIFDRVSQTYPRAICVSLDADTEVGPAYISQLKADFARYPNGLGLAVPYYHRLPHDRSRARRLLRYEIYMRYYQLSLWRIGSPYAFLPLGSAMAFRAEAYRRMGGIPARKAGEDFYFLQQLRKTGPLIRWSTATVYPSARPSDRVPFGTGPLMDQADAALVRQRFPFYRQADFDLLAQTFELFEPLYRKPLRLPIHEYVERYWGGEKLFRRFRKNFPDGARFTKACHEKLDGLRTLQILRFYQDRRDVLPREERELNLLLEKMGKPAVALDFENDDLDALNALRDLLFAYEGQAQQSFMAGWNLRWRW